jgi:hypothetical protein
MPSAFTGLLLTLVHRNAERSGVSRPFGAALPNHLIDRSGATSSKV